MDALARLNTSLSGRYAIDAEIGRGGMATVYLASDVRHDRPVALKVLNPELGAVLGVERFLSEIRVTANLQHPNLLPLFDSGEANGLLFYVMPYIEGESLRSALEREKQLPVDEAVHIATAVASALDYAHRHGVIHRDLKPENILLHEGQPMVADFGIALAVSNAGGNRITQTGLSLGTPQYMSPEQATGDRTIDGRTDIYSLAAVLYEMLTGEPPHSGTTAQAVIAKVITDKPRSIRLGRDTVPPHIEAAVDRALAKLPADRFHTAREFSDALLGKSVVLPGAVGSTGPRIATDLRHPSGWRNVLPWAVAAGAVAAAGIAWALAVRTSAPLPAVRYEIRPIASATIASGAGKPVAISPGGRYVGYLANVDSGTRRLFIRAADDLQSREVPGSEFASFPCFSPDGEWVAFWSRGQLMKAPVRGGSAVLLTEAPVSSRLGWSPSGWIVLSQDGRLARAPAGGGAPVPFTTPDSLHGETAQVAPLALADGKTVLYTSMAMGGATAARIGVASLEDGSSTILDVQGAWALGVLDGFLIYTTAGGTLMAVSFDLAARTVHGTPVPILDGVAGESGNPDSYIDLSADGALVYVGGSQRRELVQVSSSGNSRPLLSDGRSYRWPRLSPDGRRLALTAVSGPRSDIWLYDLPSGPLTRLTTEGTTNDRPEWIDNGRSVIFRSDRGGLNAIWIQSADGAGAARPFFEAADVKIDEGVPSPDGRYLVYQQDRVGRGEVWYRAVRGDTSPRQVGTGPNGETGARFSPDGRWVVFSSGESGATQIYVRPFPSLTARYQVSLSGGGSPVWSPDGRRIFYVVGRQLIAATVGSLDPFSITARAPVLGREFSFNGIHADYDISRDGRSIIALRPLDDDAQIVTVLNWRTELLARMSAAQR